ncbi:MAG: hypothetical protein ACI8Y7_000036 [Candidatus Woesearchaeota archaeon]|jgi:uncharacterized protein (TIGR02421 family)
MNQKRLLAIDTFFHTVEDTVVLSNISPVNLTAIEKALRKRIHNPSFEYKNPKDVWEEYLHVLDVIQLQDTPLERLLNKKRIELITKIKMLLDRSNDNFTKQSIKIYGKPSKTLLTKAYKILELEKEVPPEKIDAKSAEKMLKKAFKEMNLKWKLVKQQRMASAVISPSTRTLILKKKARFTKRFVERLIVHELGTHALRAENGRLQPYKIFQHGTAHYLATEEGLASYNEEMAGCSSRSIMRAYAGRVVAVEYALTHSFKETYKYLLKFFASKTAKILTLRAKRGLLDTSKPGAFTKDILYLKGYFQIKQFVKKGGDIRQLYIGKICVEDLEEIKTLTSLGVNLKPVFLPAHLQ